MFDVDSQDITAATQEETEDRLFFLLVATPKQPPKTFHQKIIKPFLNARGWQKVSYRSTGFRALYFLHDQQKDDDYSSSMLARCPRCKDKDDEPVIPKKKKKQNKSDKSISNSEQPVNDRYGCSSCDMWSPLQRASHDRDDLKTEIKQYKERHGGTFQVHVVLSKPVDQAEEFLEIASQPDAIE